MMDEKNPEYMFQQTNTDLLLLALSGAINTIDLIKRELVKRGLDEAGNYIGHSESLNLWFKGE